MFEEKQGVKDFGQCRFHVSEQIRTHIQLHTATTLRVFSVLGGEVTPQQYKQVAITADLHRRRALARSQNALQTLPEELKQLPRTVMLRGLKTRAKRRESIKLGHGVAGASHCKARTGLLEPPAYFKPVKLERSLIVRKSAKLESNNPGSNSQVLPDMTFSAHFNACT